MDYLLFLLVNAILFLRPSEIFPELANVSIYEAFIVTCFGFSFMKVIRQFSARSLEANPITFGVLVFLPICGLSHVMRGELELAGESIKIFFKIVVYYLLLVSVIDTPTRLRYFLLSLGIFITVLTAIAVLRYYDVITLTPPPTRLVKTEDSRNKAEKKDDGTASSIEDKYFDSRTGDIKVVKRLRGTGIFNDPNDLCLALVSGILLCFFGLTETRLGPARILCLVPLALMLLALQLTASRGGLLGLMAGLGVLFTWRFGWRKSLLLGALAMPLMLVMFGGRMTDLSEASEGTGKARLELWRDGMVLFKENPVTGIGMNEYGTYARLVAHNSFLHSFTELGIVGGCVFLGMFYCAFFGLLRLRRAYVLDGDMARMLPYVLAMVAAYAMGVLSLSRGYEVPTYTILGLAAAYLNIVPVYPANAKLELSGGLFMRIVGLSLIFLLLTDLVVRFLA